MPQENFPVSLTVTKTVTTTTQEQVDVTLSDSMVGCIEDAKAIAAKLGAPAVTTEIMALAILTRKTKANVVTTGGRILRDNFGVHADDLAQFVVAKYGKSRYSLPRSKGGLAAG